MWFLYSAIMSTMGLKRVCSKCGRTQVVKPSMKNKVVSCTNCGNKLPVPKKPEGYGS